MPEIRCVGQPVNDALRPVGDPCTNRFRGFAIPLADLAERARARGWSVTGPPMCPACRRPDPAVVRGL